MNHYYAQWDDLDESDVSDDEALLDISIDEDLNDGRGMKKFFSFVKSCDSCNSGGCSSCLT